MPVADIVLNDVLCYITTSRASLTTDNIVTNAAAFFSQEKIHAAKQTICSHASEKVIVRRGTREESVPILDLKDILAMVNRCETKDIKLPTYRANTFDSLPRIGLESVAGVILSLNDELTALNYI